MKDLFEKIKNKMICSLSVLFIVTIFLLKYVFSLAIGLSLLELLFPDTVQVFNYSLTNKAFIELCENHNYHAALAIAEGGTVDIKDTFMLFDCYSHVGEYNKAEKIGLDILSSTSSELFNDTSYKDLEESYVDVSHMLAARDLFHLYEKMGDRVKQIEMYDTLKRYCENQSYQNFLNKLKENYSEVYFDLAQNVLKGKEKLLKYSFKYELICGLYLENPNAALDSMKVFLNDIWTEPNVRRSNKLIWINRLLSWQIERKEIFNAQQSLIHAIEMSNEISSEEEAEPLGELSEYCYILHDYKNARLFMNDYMRFMNNHYDKEDIEYLLSEVRFLKYQQNDTKEKIKKISHCCVGIRNQIAKNFSGMTISQREFFVQKLREPFSYALQLLSENPSNKDLIELCFENEVFNRGLLMRSDVMLRQALKESNDSSLLDDYNKYIKLKRELVAREEITGPGNYVKKLSINNECSDLEKKIALKCSIFTNEELSDISISEIKSSLLPNEYLVSYVEIPQPQGTSLAAFVLSKQKGIEFFNLCNAKELEVLEKTEIKTLCINESINNILYKFLNNIPENSKVLYSPSGIVNRIPLSALVIDSLRTLSDIYSLSVIVNPIDIRNRDSFLKKLISRKSNGKIELEKANVSLWGGIQYGNSDSTAKDSIKDKVRSIAEKEFNRDAADIRWLGTREMFATTSKSIVRGDDLTFLPGSKEEVDNISDLLKSNVKSVKIRLFSGYSASEHTFKTETSDANILHISTHGFFNEDKQHKFNNPMHNSGLFFANANKAWNPNFQQEDYSEHYEDGILRADEIETQNLALCNLVVLSACETGLGEIKGDEGVFGLQRAFKLAGVRYVLMSLWSVPDDATKELMTRFYKNIVLGQDIETAFSDAQKTMNKDGYGILGWGGFVLLH